MPSLSEGFPLTGVQALAMGLAVVASGVGGFIDLVQQGENGFLYHPNDEQGMRNGLHALLTDPHLLLSMRRKSRALSSRFDLTTVVDGYDEIFRQITSRKRAVTETA
jgi:glycosyltransferase involved in cell wall biosynthesis